MSMLTPPGMGGKKYRITGDRYPRMRRPRNRGRIVLTVVAAVCVLGLAGWGTLELIAVFGGDGGTAQAARGKEKCREASGGATKPAGAKALPKPDTVTVNVFNATPRSGLAKSTADELKKRGFKIGKVGNAPATYDKKVKGAGILLGAPAAADGSFKLLGAQLKGAEPKADNRKGPDVDLIIGDKFKALATTKAAARTLSALAKPSAAPSMAPC